MKSIGERLRFIRSNLGLSQEELARSIDVMRTSISNIESQGRGISNKIQAKLYETHNVSLNWLITGHGFPFLEPKSKKYDDINEIKTKRSEEFIIQPDSLLEESPEYVRSSKIDNQQQDDKIIKAQVYRRLEAIQSNIARLADTHANHLIPYYDIKAMTANENIFSDSSEIPSEYLIIKGLESCDLAVSVAGNSMAGKYNNGDIIACKKASDLSVIVWGEPYLIILTDYKLIKYIFPHLSDDSKVRLVSQNSTEFPDLEINRDAIITLYHIKGKVEVTAS